MSGLLMPGSPEPRTVAGRLWQVFSKCLLGWLEINSKWKSLGWVGELKGPGTEVLNWMAFLSCPA